MCSFPVTSYGIICYRLVADNSSIHPEYLMVQRKDSLGFVEFVRGKYNIDDENYIAALLSNMTLSEREMLLFDGGRMEYLWTYLWRDLSSSKRRCQSSFHRIDSITNTKDYEEAKHKFDSVKSYLPELLEKYPSEIQETEWGFPKGRRNMNETDIDCALREFHEETGLNPKGLRPLKPSETASVTEQFQGSNGVWYRHVYFVSKASSKMMQRCDTNGRYNHCNGEIRSVGWFSYDECLKKIRSAYPQRRNVIDIVNIAIIESMKNSVVPNIPSMPPQVTTNNNSNSYGRTEKKITFV